MSCHECPGGKSVSQGGAVRETTCVASSESVESFLLKDGMVHAVLLAHDVSTRKTHVGHRGAMVFMGWIFGLHTRLQDPWADVTGKIEYFRASGKLCGDRMKSDRCMKGRLAKPMNFHQTHWEIMNGCCGCLTGLAPQHRLLPALSLPILSWNFPVPVAEPRSRPLMDRKRPRLLVANVGVWHPCRPGRRRSRPVG